MTGRERPIRGRLPLQSIALLLLFLLFAGSRIVHPLADPPKDLSPSLGLFFDEGVYNHNARNLITFGQWKLDEWNDFYYSAVSTGVKYLVYGVIGVGRIQIRLLSIAYSLLSLLLLFLAARESHGRRAGLLTLLLFGANYVSVMYARTGMQDTQTLAVFVAGYYFLQKGVSRLRGGGGGMRLPLFLGGILVFLSYTYKNLFLYLLPVAPVALLLLALLAWRDRAARGVALRGASWAVGGMTAAFAAWWVAFYLPFREQIAGFGSFFTRQMFPTFDPAALARNFFRTSWFDLFAYDPVLLAGTVVALLGAIIVVSSDERSRLQGADLLACVWFLAAFVFTSIIAYRPTRYFLPVIPPMCLLTARVIALLWRGGPFRVPRVSWPFVPLAGLLGGVILHHLAFIRLPRHLRRLDAVFDSLPSGVAPAASMAVAAALAFAGLLLLRRLAGREFAIPSRGAAAAALLLVAGAMAAEAIPYGRWLLSPHYTVDRTGRDIAAQLGPEAAIGGMDSLGVAFDTPYRTVTSWPGFVNYRKDPIAAYGLTHLFLADSAGVRERAYYTEQNPDAMRRAVHLKRYYLKDVPFDLYSLVECSVEEMAVTAGGEAGGPLAVRLLLRNNDPRRGKEVAVTGEIFPAGAPAVPEPPVGRIVGRCALKAGEERSLELAGNLPEAPGSYRLFLSHLPPVTSVREVEEMARQVGKVVADPAASSGRALVRKGAAGDSPAYLAFGDYLDRGPGLYEAGFTLRCDGEPGPGVVVVIDVAADRGRTILARRELTAADIGGPGGYREATLPFALLAGAKGVELRILSTGACGLAADSIRLLARGGSWSEELPVR